MNRIPFDPDTPLPPHGSAPQPDVRLLPCHVCGTATPWAVLSQHGGRCVDCFEAYCRNVEPKPRWAPATGPGDWKAWAWALKAREEADRRSLTPAQREMWRYALRRELDERLADDDARAA